MFRAWAGATDLGLIALALIFTAWGLLCQAELRSFNGSAMMSPALREIKQRAAFSVSATVIIYSAIVAVTILLVAS
jgi:hypothetical protein